jgi:dienelactone hydrolase
MDVVEESVEMGVVERRFDLKAHGEVVPGIHWLPDGASGPHPTVLIGHGGTQHKRVENVLALARRLVRHLGVGVIALDAPEHGDRVSDPDAARAARKALEERVASGARGMLAPMPEERMRAMAARIPKHVAEWRVLLDDLQEDERSAAGPFGWWGVSMGTSHGLPLLAEEPRLTAAVLGLNAIRPGDERMTALAGRVTVPVLFLLQAHDELMTRAAGLALWDALGSAEKSLHMNPGGHVQIPRFERAAAEEFFRRHLL